MINIKKNAHFHYLSGIWKLKQSALKTGKIDGDWSYPALVFSH